MKKAEFNKIVQEGLDRGKNYLVVKIISDCSVAPEVIINPVVNIKDKLAYYNKAYDEDMELISAKVSGTIIKVEDVLLTSNLNDINWFIF